MHVSRTDRVAFDWLIWSNQFGLLKSKSNTLTPKINSQTYWPREISHVMNGIHLLCSFNICHFSSTRLFWSDVDKNARRIRWRKSHSKIEGDDEFSLAMQRKDSWRACLYCIWKPGEDQIWKSNTFVSSWNWAASTEQGDLIKDAYSSSYSEWNADTRIGLLKSGNLMN